MIFAYKEIKITDHQYSSGEDWFKTAKPKILEQNPLANLPYLDTGKDVICQTNAILNYVGARFRLNGRSRRGKVMNDQLLCEIYDVRDLMIILSYPHRDFCRSEDE